MTLPAIGRTRFEARLAARSLHSLDHLATAAAWLRRILASPSQESTREMPQFKLAMDVHAASIVEVCMTDEGKRQPP